MHVCVWLYGHKCTRPSLLYLLKSFNKRNNNNNTNKNMIKEYFEHAVLTKKATDKPCRAMHIV